MPDSSSFLCLGGCVIDRVGETLAPQPHPHTSNIGRMRTSLGGVARNVAENLVRLGAKARLFSRVGNDLDGQQLVELSQKAGIDMSDVLHVTGAQTASYTAIFSGDGELVIGLADMAIFDRIGPEDITAFLTGDGQQAFIFVDANLPQPVLEKVAEHKRGRILAAVPVSQQKLPRFMPILESIDILFLNRYEAATLLGDMSSSAHALADRLASGPIRQGLLTLGPEGALAWCNGRVTSIPALPSSPVNVNGAGDCLAAATLARLAAGDDFTIAATRAMAAAALTVESEQTVRSDLSMATLMARFNNPDAENPSR